MCFIFICTSLICCKFNYLFMHSFVFSLIIHLCSFPIFMLAYLSFVHLLSTFEHSILFWNTLDLPKSCKGNTDSSCNPLTQISPLSTTYTTMVSESKLRSWGDLSLCHSLSLLCNTDFQINLKH